MQSLDYFESGNLCDHHFTSSFKYFDTILQRPYILCNPNFYKSSDYINSWPEEFDYPDLFTHRELPRYDVYKNKLLTHESRHKPTVLKLHKLSERLDKNIGVLVNSCFNARNWRDIVDNYFIYYGFFPDNVYPFLDIYHDELVSEYRPKWKIPRYNSPISEFDFTTALEDMYINKPNPIVPRVMRCFNTTSCEVEPTIFEGGSVITGSVRIAQGLWNFATCKEETNSKIKNAIERWMLELLDLAINCSVGKILMSFVKLIGEFVSITGMLERLQNITTYCYKYLCDRIKSTLPQPQLSEVVEPTFGSTAFTLQSYDNIPALASSFAAGAVIFASLFIVKNIGDKPNKNVFESLADGFHSIAKYKNGIGAVISMVKEFSSYVHEAFFQMLIGEREGSLYQRIMLTNVPAIEGCNKEDFFVYIEYLLNPANLLEINRSETLQNQIRFCVSILESISKYCAENPQHSMPAATKEYVNKLLTSLHSLWKEVSKRPIVDSVRFCPFWINLIGESGLGKSTFVPILSNYIRESLLAIGTDFQLTPPNNWLYPMNFTDKYLTHYNGQYIMTIDDFLQDAPGTLETSTALSLISFVSAVPYYTVQAAISDKGTPFTSKIIISTSNDTGVFRKEIICPDALRNRIRMNILIERKPNAQPDDIDPLFKTRCVFKLVKPGTQQAYKTYDDSLSLIRDIVTQYVDWYNLQQRILSSRDASPHNVGQIAQHVINHINQQNAVQPTASWRCLMHLQPTISTQISKWDNKDLLLEQYDCDCDHHSYLNESYHKYMRVVGIGKALPLDKFMNYENSQMHKQIVAHKSQYTRYRESCMAMCDKIWNAPHFKWIATLLASITACAAAYLLRDSFSTPPIEEEVEDTKVQYNISKPGRIAPRIVKVEATQNVEEIEPILANTLNKQAYDLAYNGILNRGNICTLAFKRNNQLFTGTALRIGGRAILTNDHFFEKMDDVRKFEILIRTNSGLQRLEQVYNPDMYRKLGDIDAGIYLCDGSLSQSKSLVKHFCMDNVLANYVEAMVLTLHPKNHVPMVMTNVIAEPNLTTHQYEVGSEVYYTLNSYKTNCRVEKGMSGSILLATSNGIKNKILGIQTCRNINDETGYFKPISQNMINKALDSLGVMATLEPAVEETCFAITVGFEKPPNLGNGRLEYLGGLPKNKTVRGQTETKIRESLIHDISSRTQEPSVLDDKDMRMDPSLRGKPILYRAMEGFDHDIGSVDTKLLSTCVDELAVEYDVTLDIPSIPRRLLTDLEMVNGVPGVINRVEMKSSPGYPYVLERKDTTRGGKFEWFVEEPPQEGYTKVYSMKPSLASGLEQREQALLNGKQFPTIAYACLKDETRPLAKITNGKTRAFICLPLDFNLLIRKYFGAFIAALHSKAGKVTSCVGIDPAKQWREVYDKLIAVNCLWEDFDYANWDQHLHPELVLRVANIVNYWYGDLIDSPAGKLRYLLLDTLVHTTIIVKDRVFCKSCGQCSGCAITAELNCLVHDILMYYMWRKVALDKNFETHLQHYRDNVASIMYGDDIVIAVTPEFQSIFNGEQLSPLMAELGMNITPGDKVSTKFIAKHPSDIYFLKRNFVKDGDYVKAPLRPDIVENIFQWIHKSDNDIDATLNNCETALREAYMHGRTYFDSLLTKINGRIKDYNRLHKGNLKPVVFSYDSFDEKYREEDFSCAGLDAFVHVQS